MATDSFNLQKSQTNKCLEILLLKKYMPVARSETVELWSSSVSVFSSGSWCFSVSFAHPEDSDGSSQRGWKFSLQHLGGLETLLRIVHILQLHQVVINPKSVAHVAAVTEFTVEEFSRTIFWHLSVVLEETLHRCLCSAYFSRSSGVDFLRWCLTWDSSRSSRFS